MRRNMRRELNIFVDPKTERPLLLKTAKMGGGHVISGTLYSDSSRYPIINGIPRFVDREYYTREASSHPEAKTTASFGNKWREARNRRLGAAKQDIKSLKEQFMAMLGCRSISELKEVLSGSKTILNAGCGVAWSEYLFNYDRNARRHSVDLSLSVDVAHDRTKDMKNVIVSQASLFELPYKDGVFDVAYSLGVLHHTPDPQKAFYSLLRKVKEGGILGIYIYNIKPLLRESADSRIRKYTTAMSYDKCMEFSKKMTRLGRNINKIKEMLTVEDDIDLLGIKRGRYNVHQFIYEHFLKCWYSPKWDTGYADLANQDWYHPYYASHHTEEEVTGWFKKAKMKNVKRIKPRGWEHSGFFISGTKR